MGIEEKVRLNDEFCRILARLWDEDKISMKQIETYIRTYVADTMKNSYPPTVVGWRWLAQLGFLSAEEIAELKNFGKGVLESYPICPLTNEMIQGSYQSQTFHLDI